MIINIGCKHDELTTIGSITDWITPKFSEDPDSAFAAVDSYSPRVLISRVPYIVMF